MSNRSHNQFLNEAVMPWDQLSLKLAQPLSVDPLSSKIAADAGAVLTALRHAPERFGWPQKGSKLNAAVVAEFAQHELITDAADSWKHGKLKDSKRQTSFIVKSQFLLNPQGQSRFLRNIVQLQHATLGTFDFLEVSRSAIRFWLQRENVSLKWRGVIFEGADVYRDAALLTTSPGIQVLQHSATFSFVLPDEQGGRRMAPPGNRIFAIVDDDSLLLHAPLPTSH